MQANSSVSQPVVQGPAVQTFPRTLSLGNWPFLVFLMLIGLMASIPSYLDDNWKMVGIILGSVLAIPVIFGVVQLVSEAFGEKGPAAIHANGLLVRRLWRTSFIPWQDITRIERKIVIIRLRGAMIRQTVYDVVGRGGATCVRLRPLVHGGEKSVALIVEGARLRWSGDVASG